MDVNGGGLKNERVSSISFLVFLNGSLTSLFTGTRVLRQGDPLFPFFVYNNSGRLWEFDEKTNVSSMMHSFKIGEGQKEITHLQS